MDYNIQVLKDETKANVIREFIRLMLTELGAVKEHIEYELNKNNEERIKKLIRNEQILVAEVNGKIVGFQQYNISGGVCNLSKLYIKPEYRKKGIATALIKKAIEIAKQKNCHKITGTVRETNNPMQRLFEKLGFKRECCLRRHYFKTTFFIYSKFLE